MKHLLKLMYSDAEIAATKLAFLRLTSEQSTLDAELDLFRSRAGVIRAQLACAEAHLKLELATGRKI